LNKSKKFGPKPKKVLSKGLKKIAKAKALEKKLKKIAKKTKPLSGTDKLIIQAKRIAQAKK